MCSQDVLHCLFTAPARTIAKRAWKTIFVHRLDAPFVLLGNAVAADGVLAEEGVLEVARWMTLRLEKRVEVPETRLDPAICRHLVEAHREENFAELGANFQ